jgi:hypothetical protein
MGWVVAKASQVDDYGRRRVTKKGRPCAGVPQPGSPAATGTAAAEFRTTTTSVRR